MLGLNVSSSWMKLKMQQLWKTTPRREKYCYPKRPGLNGCWLLKNRTGDVMSRNMRPFPGQAAKSAVYHQPPPKSYLNSDTHWFLRQWLNGSSEPSSNNPHFPTMTQGRLMPLSYWSRNSQCKCKDWWRRRKRHGISVKETLQNTSSAPGTQTKWPQGRTGCEFIVHAQ